VVQPNAARARRAAAAVSICSADRLRPWLQLIALRAAGELDSLVGLAIRTHSLR